MTGTEKTVEYRGCRGVVIAEVLVDNNIPEEEGGGYVTGPVMKLAPVAEISKTTELSSETKFYDNQAAFNHTGEGPDTVTLTCAVPDDEVRALIEGRYYSEELKQYIEIPRKDRYFALGYILGEEGTKSDEIFVWKYKGTFNILDQTSATKDNGTSGNNVSIVYTGVFTKHLFEFPNDEGIYVQPAKGIAVRASDAFEDAFFGGVFLPGGNPNE